jgi:hypothetical protein
MDRDPDALAQSPGRAVWPEDASPHWGRCRHSIGIFPVVSETPHRLVAGFNDKHLDFRVVVDVAPSNHGQYVTATTLVLTHNLLGRTYLAIILPFHRLIARTMLRQVAA